ncbi:MAG TPA: DNA-formamidopyrimidine glycosylase family protein [Candidatus Elarobacter sp.]|nr:DNA-formamidopyrimidine glycosylase family protein [Candidatus Elarobacter sp.]
MPELPDVAAYISALEPRIVGRPLLRVRLASPFLLRTADPPIASVDGRVVRELRRVGKRIAIGLDGDLWLVLHLMIAGRLHWRAPGATLAGRNALAAFNFADGSLVLTEAGSKRRASLHLFHGAESLDAIDPGGIDVFAAGLDAFRAALSAENHTLKRALTDPRFVSGIGNAYSDEILHAAQLSPVLQTRQLTGEQWQRLYDATRTTLRTWIDRLTAEAQSGFPEKVTAFRKDMAVHGRFGEACPVCGAPVQRIRYADNDTNYCPGCQTGGKLLADRSLSRLLGADWPRSLDELEALKRR